MTAVKVDSLIFLFLSSLILTEVTPWTVDLADVVRILDQEQIDQNNTDDDYIVNANIESDFGNEVYPSNYAEDFEYQSYGRKEASNIFKNGTIYLDGLSRALAVYRDILDHCASNYSKLRGEELSKCETAEKKKDYVQKLSEMALITTDKLRDEAYDNTHQDDGVEEQDLMKLAWTLDKLAYLTGYQPSQDNPEKIDPDTPVTIKAELPIKSTKEQVQELEILEQVENGRPLSKLPPKTLTDVKSVRKRDTDDVMKYYMKYKLWNGSNIMKENKNDYNNEFDVQNHLNVLPIKKRSIPDKKKAANMRILLMIRKFQNKLKSHPKNSQARKLIKSIKVYRRQVLKNN